MAEDYEYDVFFSYKRHDLTLDWTRQVAQHLKLWLTEELGGREARLFVDEDRIEVGDHWPDALKQSLKRSKCMVAVWSPSYFQSNWCVSEWRSFLEREKVAEMAPHGLIAPLRFHDGDYFPDEAKSVQWMDVAPFAVTVPAFWTTVRAIELEEKLKEFSGSLAKIVNAAPAFRPDWPVVDATGNPAPRIQLAKL